MRLFFSIPGEPVAKQRPRINRFSGRAYTPKETTNYETLVRLSFANAFPEHVPFPREQPLFVKIEAYFPVPASVSKKKRGEMLSGAIRHTKQKDADNIAKAVLDGLNGVAFADDCSVVDLVVRKFYGENPQVFVTIDSAIENLPFVEEVL